MLGKVARAGAVGAFLRWSSSLRFPYLLLMTSLLFVANLFIPDMIPLLDEIIMGLVTVLLASLRKAPVESKSQ